MTVAASPARGMPALTVWQPWATLIAAGLKPFEFRRWPAPVWVRTKRIAIHAGARPVRKGEIAGLLYTLRTEGCRGTALDVEGSIPLLERVLTTPGILPLSSVLCTAVLHQPIRATALGADIADSDRVDHSVWAWPLLDVEPVQPIVPARGAQGFWRWVPPHDGAAA